MCYTARILDYIAEGQLRKGQSKRNPSKAISCVLKDGRREINTTYSSKV